MSANIAAGTCVEATSAALTDTWRTARDIRDEIDTWTLSTVRQTLGSLVSIGRAEVKTEQVNQGTRNHYRRAQTR